MYTCSLYSVYRVQCSLYNQSCQLSVELYGQLGGKFSRKGKNSAPWLRHLYLKHKNYLCLCQWQKYVIFWTYLALEWTKRLHFQEVRLLFGPVPKSAKIPNFGSRFVRQLHFTFYSALFDSCGRTIGQLATLCTVPVVSFRKCTFWPRKMAVWYGQRQSVLIDWGHMHCTVSFITLSVKKGGAVRTGI